MKTTFETKTFDQVLFLGEAGKASLINTSDIIYLEADNNYCRVYIKGGKEIVVCRTLGSYADELSPKIFFRCHKSFLVNIHYIREYQNRKNEFVIVLINGINLQVARRRVSELKRFLQMGYLNVTEGINTDN